MDNINIRKSTTESKIFALVVSSKYGQILHVGVHFNLEDAYVNARKKLESIAAHNPSDSIDIGLWDSVPARRIIDAFIDPIHVEVMPIVPEVPVIVEKEPIPTVDDYVKDIKDSKNDLMKKLIEEGDLTKVEQLKEFLGTYSKRFVIKAIKEKIANNQSTVDNSAENGTI